ncbi:MULTISPECIES: alpha/beta fold hydrolase [Paenibacillus]|uniref:alpha/beta fold hydrolase n=1 Tax=Paenibacillus TaxID=44249 RepID=UPI0022B8B07E|nr:alpha/beta hydrolase [Paenibacillus caseinilyticus]MCZ8521205.1 alpha/beta hydrolase [Paenibacillus caseinilyticus]
MAGLSERFVETNGVRLHVVTCGPQDGPLVVLLHGFPEFWYGWKDQIPFLAAEGYRVWVPDQRGYNLSDKPEGVPAYAMNELAADVAGLIDAAGGGPAYLVGHDFGAMVAWYASALYPEKVRSAVMINVPHPEVMFRKVRSSLRQMVRSSYAMFFQLPWLPETAAKWGRWKTLVEVLERSSRAGTFSEADMEHYRRAWDQPRAYTSMLNWYRCFWRKKGRAPIREIRIPVLIIWGEQDLFLLPEMAGESMAWCAGGARLEKLPEATHWVQHEEAAHVNKLLREWFRTYSKSDGGAVT